MEKARKPGSHRPEPRQKHVFCAFQEKAILTESLPPEFEKKMAVLRKIFTFFQKSCLGAVTVG